MSAAPAPAAAAGAPRPGRPASELVRMLLWGSILEPREMGEAAAPR